MIPEINESIEVIDISKSGVGFTCKKELPIGFYFDAKIQLPTKHFLTVIKILNTREIEEGYRIGCEFVGLGDILSKSVEEYDEELQKTSK